jgi:hypothetical protein
MHGRRRVALDMSKTRQVPSEVVQPTRTRLHNTGRPKISSHRRSLDSASALQIASLMASVASTGIRAGDGHRTARLESLELIEYMLLLLMMHNVNFLL